MFVIFYPPFLTDHSKSCFSDTVTSTTVYLWATLTLCKNRQIKLTI